MLRARPHLSDGLLLVSILSFHDYQPLGLYLLLCEHQFLDLLLAKLLCLNLLPLHHMVLADLYLLAGTSHSRRHGRLAGLLSDSVLGGLLDLAVRVPLRCHVNGLRVCLMHLVYGVHVFILCAQLNYLLIFA